VVNVDESSLNAVKQSVATAQAMANSASSQALQAKTTASAANNTAAAALAKVAEQSKQIEQLQAQINALLTPNQVTDLVWSKIWDVNYLIRLGFVEGKSADPSVQNYLVDLAYYIKKWVNK
jgi:D-alanyl-D-alanine dipeptidase